LQLTGARLSAERRIRNPEADRPQPKRDCYAAKQLGGGNVRIEEELVDVPGGSVFVRKWISSNATATHL